MTVNDNFDLEQVNEKFGLPEDRIGLREFLTHVLEAKWLIAIITGFTLLVGAAYAWTIRPVYRADLLMQVGEVADFSDLFNQQPFAKPNIDRIVAAVSLIFGSRRIVGKTLDELQLDIEANPSYFSLIGEVVARHYDPLQPGLAEPWFELCQYAWGGESIEVEKFEVVPGLLDKSLILVARGHDRYGLFGPENELLLEGRVGESARRTLDDEESIILFVSVLKARPGTRFELIKHSRSKAIENLKKQFNTREAKEGSGLVKMQLSDSDPVRASEILNKIADRYSRYQTDRKSAQVEKILQRLQAKLPELRYRVKTATESYDDYRRGQGSVDLDIETRSLLDRIVDLEQQRNSLQQNRANLKRTLLPKHPQLIKLDSQIGLVRRTIMTLNKKIEQLPEIQQSIFRLSQEVKISTDLYTRIINAIERVRIAETEDPYNVRIIDYAIPPIAPIWPKKWLILIISGFLGLILGIAATFLRLALKNTVEDPVFAEQQLSLPVYGAIFQSKNEARLHKARRANATNLGSKSEHSSLLTVEYPDDPAVESFRSLRTLLHFALVNAKNNIVLFTGPSTAIGKSFVTANLAVVLGANGKKILLIDGDLRKGSLHNYFGVPEKPGLSDLISANERHEQYIHQTECEGVSIIPRGELPPNPSELLMNARFVSLLEGVSDYYDHVIIDSPPILAVSDAAIIGRMADTTLMVIKSGEHSIRDLKQSVKHLKQVGVQLRGLVFNGVNINERKYGYIGYGYSRYGYQNGAKKRWVWSVLIIIKRTRTSFMSFVKDNLFRPK